MVRHARTMVGVLAFSRDNLAAAPHCPCMRRLLPVLLLVVLAVAGFALLRAVGWGGLARHQALLRAWVAVHPITSAGAYLLVYVAAVSVSVPNAGVLTIAGGLMFGKFL